MQSRPIRILVVAGGTGGHLFPAMAVIEEIQRLTENSAEVEFIGNASRIEADIVPRAGYKFHPIPMIGLQKALTLKTVKFAYNALRSLLRSRSLLKEFRPDIVLCAGAYISYPVGIAASQLSIPLFLMESNVYPGKAILQLAPRAQKIFTSFEESTKYFRPKAQPHVEVTGNPIRQAFATLPDKEEARLAFGLQHKPTILCFGGSTGANSINQVMERCLKNFTTTGIQVIWQTGKFYVPNYENIPPEVPTIFPFLHDMATAYAAADLVVCRAGATSIAELCLAGKPSILIPLPHAANNHQEINAKVMEAHKASIIISDKFMEEKLLDTVMTLMTNPQQLKEMSDNARKLATPHAALHIAEAILRLRETQLI